MKNITNSLNIIYLCTAEKGPSGGAKTIYNHSELINRLNIPKITSEISHIKKRKISKWNSSIKKLFKIHPRNYFGWSAKDIRLVKTFQNGLKII